MSQELEIGDVFRQWYSVVEGNKRWSYVVYVGSGGLKKLQSGQGIRESDRDLKKKVRSGDLERVELDELDDDDLNARREQLQDELNQLQETLDDIDDDERDELGGWPESLADRIEGLKRALADCDADDDDDDPELMADGGRDRMANETDTLDELAAALDQSDAETEIAEPSDGPRTLWARLPASHDKRTSINEHTLPDWATITATQWFVDEYRTEDGVTLDLEEPMVAIAIQDRRDRQCPEAYVQEIAAAIREGGAPAQGIDHWATDELGLTGQEWGDMTNRDKSTVLRNARRARGDE